MKSKITVCNTISYVIFILLVLLVVPFVVPRAIGIEPYGILSDSMEPFIPVGSVVYVKTCESADVEEGDVITFKLGAASANVATHRVVEIDNEKKQFITKGDHNEENDTNPVVFDRLIGKVMITVPYLGDIYSWLISTMGVAICAFAFFIAAILWFFVAKWRKQLKTDRTQRL